MKKIILVLTLLLVMGLVFASEEITIGFGEKNPAPFNWIESFHNNYNRETVVQWEFTNTLARDVLLNEIVLKASGTGNDSLIHVSLYEDTTNVGYYNGSQKYLGSFYFNADDGTATFTIYTETIIPANDSMNYIVELKTYILQHEYEATFRHSIESLTGEIKNIGTPVTGTYGIKTTLSPLITYYPNQYYFVELNSENGLMSWVSNASGYPGHGEMLVNGVIIENKSLTANAFLGCGVDDTKNVGLIDGEGGQYLIKTNQPISQSFVTSREDFSSINVIMRSIQYGGTDNITMILRKGTIDGEIIGQKTITITPTTSELVYTFVLNDCAGDTLCGNYILESGEECDSYAYNKTCLDYDSFYSGSLSCTSGCTISTFSCNTQAEDLKANCISAGQEYNSFACTILNETYNTEYIGGLFTFNGTCDANLEECELAEVIILPVDNNYPVDTNLPIENPTQDPPTDNNNHTEDAPVPGEENTLPTCGNGIIELGEYCDVGELQGASCTDFDYDKGILGCNNQCNYDTSNCVKVNEKGEVIATGSINENESNKLQTTSDLNQNNTPDAPLDNILVLIAGIIIVVFIGTGYYLIKIKPKTSKTK